MYLQNGGTHKVKNLTGTTILNTIAVGRATSKNIPTEMPLGVNNLYANNGLVLEADTMDSLTINHTAISNGEN